MASATRWGVCVFAAATFPLTVACGQTAGTGVARSHTAAVIEATPTAPADPTSAEDDISRAWEKFTDPQVANTEKKRLIESGEANERLVRAFLKDEYARRLLARVEIVAFTSATRAQVTYSLFRDGRSVLPRSTGVSVRENGRWKLSRTTLCSWMPYGSSTAEASGC
ncbi:hypothetical protein HS041_19970 [Planomonospora sp. ID67723]|uniref:hypothetical protein n=1 Tax=Planomonospora sp. ID67723 TaxID=2738134 RepID=UPI0018C44259|nr:hypothetical protein [Planomonospora sp. ID67723]MBG0830048.1 hypothetical protein [Planomonospora sp. ID67723]